MTEGPDTINEFFLNIKSTFNDTFNQSEEINI